MAAEVRKAGRVRHDDAADPTPPAGRAPTRCPSPRPARPRRPCRCPTCATRSSSPSASCSRRSSSTRSSSTTPRSTRSRPEAFVAPAHRAVLDGIRIAAPTARRASTAAWVAAVAEAAPLAVRGLVSELSVAPLPTRYDASTGLPPQRYLDSLVVGVRDAAPRAAHRRRHGVGAPRAERPRVRPRRPAGAHDGPAPPRDRAGRACARGSPREAAVDRPAPTPPCRDDVAAAIAPEEHERLLAWAVEDGSGVTVVAGRHRLYAVDARSRRARTSRCPGRGTSSTPALWSGEDGSLRVTWVDGERPGAVRADRARDAARDAARAGAGVGGARRGDRPRAAGARPASSSARTSRRVRC